MGLRIIVVGFGFMGQTHAGNILKNPRAELAAVVDPYSPFDRLSTIRGNKETVSLTPEEIRPIPHYTTMEEAFEKVRADAVIIALPTKLHYSSVMRSLELGFNVMVEKPFSIDAGECGRMTLLAKEKGKTLAVGYVVRCMREYMLLRDCVHSGKLGKLKFLSLSRITGMPAWGNWTDPEFIKASGGALFDLFSHDVDFMRFCLGEPDSIVADKIVCREFNGNLISAVFRYPEVNVRIDGGFVSPPTFPFRRNFTAFFEGGTMISDGPGELKTALPGGVSEQSFKDDNPYYTEVDNFVTAVATGDVSGISTGEDAAHSLLCCHNIASQLGWQSGKQ